MSGRYYKRRKLLTVISDEAEDHPAITRNQNGITPIGGMDLSEEINFSNADTDLIGLTSFKPWPM